MKTISKLSAAFFLLSALVGCKAIVNEFAFHPNNTDKK